MRKKMFSFIVIAFNEESNIIKCLDSLENIKLPSNFKSEIVIVNDGSYDRTLKVLNDYKENYKNIKIISFKTNRGRGYARHAGVINSNSCYIIFVDADIILPSNWILKTFRFIKKFDIVGGIAVPDGDMAYVCNKLNLNQKIVPHTSKVTGSNVLIKRDVFKKYNFNKNLRDGEDTDLIWKAESNNFKIKVVKDLVAKHNDNKGFINSVSRFYSYGKNANFLLLKYKKIRLPDIAFIGFIVTSLISILFTWNITIPFLSLLLYSWILSLLYLGKKIEIRFMEIGKYFFASMLYTLPVFAYNIGRIKGIIKISKNTV